MREQKAAAFKKHLIHHKTLSASDVLAGFFLSFTISTWQVTP